MLFTHGGRSIENIPPTRETLKQHILKAALKKQCCYHNPTEWGSKSLMKNVSCFRAIYQMQKRPAGNLIMQRQMQLLQARTTVYRVKWLCRTVLSYSKANIPIANRNIFKVSHKRLGKVLI